MCGHVARVTYYLCPNLLAWMVKCGVSRFLHRVLGGHSGSLGYGGLYMQHLGHALVAISNREAEFQEIVSYFVKAF